MKISYLSIILMVAIGISVIAGRDIGIAHGEPTQTHYFEIWAKDKNEQIGFPATIQANICPAPVPDLGTNSSIKVYASKHSWVNGYDVATTYVLGENSTLPSCGIPSNIATFQTNSTASYVVAKAVAQWTEKGKTITLQGSSAPIQILDNCIGVWGQIPSNSNLHSGSMASFKFHVYSFDCKGPSSVIFTAYNYTGNVKSNTLYRELKLVTTNETLFNFTLPQWTESNGLFHFLVQVNSSFGFNYDSEPFIASNTVEVLKSHNATMLANPSTQVPNVPEFSLVIIILLLSIVSLLVFYRKKFGK